MTTIRLGVDIGRVIIAGPAHPGGDTAFFSGDEATMLATPEVAGAVDALALLVERCAGQVWLVSKCGPRVQARTRRWLDVHDVFGRTGIRPSDVRFCLRRPQKRDHCVDLGLTDFVDDRPDVHAAIRDVVGGRYLFGPQSRPVPDFVVPTPTWPDVLAALEGAPDRETPHRPSVTARRADRPVGPPAVPLHLIATERGLGSGVHPSG